MHTKHVQDQGSTSYPSSVSSTEEFSLPTQRGKKFPHRWFLDCGWGKRQKGVNGQQLIISRFKNRHPYLTCAAEVSFRAYTPAGGRAFHVSMKNWFSSCSEREGKPRQHQLPVCTSVGMSPDARMRPLLPTWVPCDRPMPSKQASLN